MHNFLMRLRRYKALTFAVLPFIISGLFWLCYTSTEGYTPILVLLLWIASMPMQAIMSVASVVFAFSKKDPERRFRETARVVSVISTIVFGGFTLAGIAGAVTSMLGIH